MVFPNGDGSNEAGTELGIEATTVEAEKPVVIETEPASKSEPETEAELETIPIIPETTSNSYTQLQKGSKGEQVVELQRRLTELGYDPSGIDGDYGDGTTAAIRAFQKANGLAINGVAFRGQIQVSLASYKKGSSLCQLCGKWLGKDPIPKRHRIRFGGFPFGYGDPYDCCGDNTSGAGDDSTERPHRSKYGSGTYTDPCGLCLDYPKQQKVSS